MERTCGYKLFMLEVINTLKRIEVDIIIDQMISCTFPFLTCSAGYFATVVFKYSQTYLRMPRALSPLRFLTQENVECLVSLACEDKSNLS